MHAKYKHIFPLTLELKSKYMVVRLNPDYSNFFNSFQRQLTLQKVKLKIRLFYKISLRYKKIYWESLSAFWDFSRNEQGGYLKERFLPMCLEYLSLNASLVIISISKTSEGCLKYLQDYHYLPLSFQLSTLILISILLIFPGLWVEVLYPMVQLSLFILWTVDFLLAQLLPPFSLSSSFLSPVLHVNPSLVHLAHYIFYFTFTLCHLPSWSAWLSASTPHIVPGCAVGL